MPLSLSYCQYHRAAESMAQAQPNLLAGRARLRRPPTGDFKREARSHWPPRAFTPRQACSAESWSGIGGARGAEKQEGVKRRGPGLGEAPGTRMQPRAWAPGLPLPPGRLKWATAASARPERSTTGAPEAGASARRDPVDSERLHRGFRGPQCPGTSGFSPQSPHSARDPELPGARCSHGPGSPPKNPQWPSLNLWEARPRVGLSPGPPEMSVPNISSLVLLRISGDAKSPVAYADGNAVTRSSRLAVVCSRCFWPPNHLAPNLTDFN